MISQNTPVIQIQLIISTSYFETAQQISEISRSDKKFQNAQPDINWLTFLFSMRRNKSRVIFDSFKTDSIAPAFAQLSDFYLHIKDGNPCAMGQTSAPHKSFPWWQQWLQCSQNWADEGNTAPAVTSAWKHLNGSDSSVSSQRNSCLILFTFTELRVHDISIDATAS